MSSYESQTRKGWFNTEPRTGEASTSLKIVLVAMAGIPLLAVQHTDYVENNVTVRASGNVQYQNVAVLSQNEFSIEQSLERIKTVFGFGISKLSVAMGVSRQAIYNWKNGEQPTAENIVKLQDLTNAAKTISESGIAVTGLLMKRKIAGGESLLDLALEGSSVSEAALLLVRQVRLEQDQQARLASRFVARRPSSVSIDSDLFLDDGLG
jgi:transcriptional regulator with XRE-family HTH domain